MSYRMPMEADGDHRWRRGCYRQIGMQVPRQRLVHQACDSNQIYFDINSVHNITMSLHCIWLDRQAITSRLCLPMTTKP